MFKRKTKEVEELKNRIIFLENLLGEVGHTHKFIEIKKELINGFDASNGERDIYKIEKICTGCQKRVVEIDRSSYF